MPMLGTHKTVVATAGNVPRSLRSGRAVSAGPHFKRYPKMKKLICILTMLLSAAISPAADIKVELDPIPEWQKPVMDKVTFGVKMRSLSGILNRPADKPAPSFLVFTSKAAENLGKRLLWVDVEVEFSNGAVRKFDHVKFSLLGKGIEADVRKLDEGPKQIKDPKTIEITRLKIINAARK